MLGRLLLTLNSLLLILSRLLLTLGRLLLMLGRLLLTLGRLLLMLGRLLLTLDRLLLILSRLLHSLRSFAMTVVDLFVILSKNIQKLILHQCQQYIFYVHEILSCCTKFGAAKQTYHTLLINALRYD